MRIAVITKNIGLTPTGRVFETLVSHLVKYCEITIICTQFVPTDKQRFDGCQIIVLPEQYISSPRIRKYLNRWGYKLLNNSYDNYWFLKAFKKINIGDFDCILSLCGSMCLYPLAMGDLLKKRTRKPFICYLVDACPQPVWWGKSSDYTGIENYLKRYTKNVDLFFSANPMMLEYQKNFISKQIPQQSFIYPIVCSSKELDIKTKNTDQINFLFTGNLYGIRKADKLFEAFSKVVKVYPNASLRFVGTKRNTISKIPDSIRNNIDFIDFTTELTPYYEKATALIDIDACVDYDVFLSSKITAYLNIPRPIISQTGNNTPSRRLLEGIQSVLLCSHDANSIYDAMIKTINNKFDYRDRKEVLDKFNYDSVSEMILEWINNKL